MSKIQNNQNHHREVFDPIYGTIDLSQPLLQDLC